MHWYSIIASLIIFSSCSSECSVVMYNGPIDYNLDAFKYDFQVNDSKCYVELHLKLTIGEAIVSTGQFTRSHGWFHYKSREPLANIPLFQMSANVGSRYLIIAQLKNRNYELTGSVINEFISAGQIVKEYKIHHGLETGGYKFDYVFFVTKENGIIGSYCTVLSDGQQIIALRSGRIFEEVYDYSDFQVIDIR